MRDTVQSIVRVLWLCFCATIGFYIGLLFTRHIGTVWTLVISTTLLLSLVAYPRIKYLREKRRSRQADSK